VTIASGGPTSAEAHAASKPADIARDEAWLDLGTPSSRSVDVVDRAIDHVEDTGRTRFPREARAPLVTRSASKNACEGGS
jgi:hypothetical protein